MGIIERRERERQQRYNAIIDSAERIFFTRGFDQATMEEVAEEAELSKATLYLYFGSKTELCMAITLRSLKFFLALLKKQIQSYSRGLDRFLAIQKAYLAFIEQKPDYFKVLLMVRNHMANCSGESAVMEEIDHINSELNQIILNALERGKMDGSIRPDLSPSKVSRVLWGTQNGLLTGLIPMGPADPSNPLMAKENIQILFELIIRGITPLQEAS